MKSIALCPVYVMLSFYLIGLLHKIENDCKHSILTVPIFSNIFLPIICQIMMKTLKCWQMFKNHFNQIKIFSKVSHPRQIEILLVVEKRSIRNFIRKAILKSECSSKKPQFLPNSYETWGK